MTRHKNEESDGAAIVYDYTQGADAETNYSLLAVESSSTPGYTAFRCASCGEEVSFLETSCPTCTASLNTNSIYWTR